MATIPGWLTRLGRSIRGLFRSKKPRTWGAANWPKPEQIVARLGKALRGDGTGRDYRFEFILGGRLAELEPWMLPLVREALELHESFPENPQTPLATDLRRSLGKGRLVRIAPGDTIRYGRPVGSLDRPESYVPIATNRRGEDTSVISMCIYTQYEPGAGSEMPLWGVITGVVLGEYPRQVPSGFTLLSDLKSADGAPIPGAFSTQRDFIGGLQTFWREWAYAGDQITCEGRLLESCPWKN